IYDVAVTEKALDGRTATDKTTAEIYVKAPPPPPPPPPYDCVGVMAKIGATFPILFGFDDTELRPPYDLSVAQAAALLKDSRCKEVKVDIVGYADYLGES